MADKKNVYEVVVERLIKEIESSETLPWRKPWSVDGQRNFNSKRRYSGINLILLEAYSMMKEWPNYWATWNGVEKAEGTVKEDQRKSWFPVVYFNRIEVDNNDPDSNEEKKFVGFYRYYRVYNIAQCDNIEVPEPKNQTPFQTNDCAEEIIRLMPNPPKISHGGDGAFYYPQLDQVQLPAQGHFEDSDAYYCTNFHELIHSTGHTSRLNRPDVMNSDGFGGEVYSKEELTAEIGAAMLSSHCNLDPSTMNRSAAYLKSWIKKLKDEPKWLFQAASKSQKAVEYILDEEIIGT